LIKKCSGIVSLGGEERARGSGGREEEERDKEQQGRRGKRKQKETMPTLSLFLSLLQILLLYLWHVTQVVSRDNGVASRGQDEELGDHGERQSWKKKMTTKDRSTVGRSMQSKREFECSFFLPSFPHVSIPSLFSTRSQFNPCEP
jgi:hypothetical protein